MLWEEELEAKRIQDDEDRKRRVTVLDLAQPQLKHTLCKEATEEGVSFPPIRYASQHPAKIMRHFFF